MYDPDIPGGYHQQNQGRAQPVINNNKRGEFFPRIPLGISLLAMNVGTQNTVSKEEKTEQQQLLGTYIKYMPRSWKLEGSFYYQLGRSEEHLPIHAWMGALRYRREHDQRLCPVFPT